MKFIKVEMKEQVACITFNRPEVYNSMDAAMRTEILDALQAAAENEAVRAIYLTGSGRAFCAGEDLAEVVDPNGPTLSEIIRTGYNPMVEMIRAIKKPVVCAVNGVAAGAGANIALACDITVATASASFTQAFSKIGLVPDSGGSWTLPRLVGMQRAAALMFLSDKISAETAQQYGLIWQVFPDDTFAADSFAIAAKLAKMPTEALWRTKHLLNASFSNTFSQQLDMEDREQTLAAQTADYKEGVASFLEKRKPVFVGK